MRLVYHDESQLVAEWQGVAQGQSLVSLPMLGAAMVKSHLSPAELAKIDIRVDSTTVACHRSQSTIGSQ